MGVTVTELVVKRSENQEDKGERPSGVPQLFCHLTFVSLFPYCKSAYFLEYLRESNVRHHRESALPTKKCLGHV